MNCEGCDRRLPEGATSCEECGRPVELRGGQLAARSASTVVFRPDELGLPGSVPSYATPPEAVGAWAGDPSRRWLWLAVALGGLAVVATAALLVLRSDSDPEVAIGAITPTALEGAPGSPSPASDPDGAAPVSPSPASVPPAPATSSTPISPASTPASSTPTPRPTPSTSPVTTPADVAEGFVVVDSDGRAALPVPVLDKPAIAWEVTVPGSVGDVAGDGNLVVIAVPSGGGGTTLIAHDAIPGSMRWTATLDGVPRPDGITLAQTVVVTLDRADAVDLVGLDRATGRQRWRLPTVDGGQLRVRTLADGRVLVTDVDRVTELDTANGQLRPVVEGRQVRLGRGLAAAYDGDRVRAVDLVDGSPRYELSVGALPDGTGLWAFTEDRVVVYDGATIWSVSTIGLREWDHNLLDPTGEVRSLVLLPDDTLLVGTVGADGTFALDQATGELRWRAQGLVDTVGQFDGQLRGLGGPDGDRVLVDLTDGRRIASVVGSAAPGGGLANGALYRHGSDAVVAVGLSDGQPRWSVPAGTVQGVRAIPGAVVLWRDDGHVMVLR